MRRARGGYQAARPEHAALEADKCLHGERVARALQKENRLKKERRLQRKLRTNAVRARAFRAGHDVTGRWEGRRVSRPSKTRRKALIEAVVARDGNFCWYCLRPFAEPFENGLVATLDHVIPISRGGANHMDNFRAACRPCNGKRGDRTQLTHRGAFVKDYQRVSA